MYVHICVSIGIYNLIYVILNAWVRATQRRRYMECHVIVNERVYDWKFREHNLYIINWNMQWELDVSCLMNSYNQSMEALVLYLKPRIVLVYVICARRRLIYVYAYAQIYVLTSVCQPNVYCIILIRNQRKESMHVHSSAFPKCTHVNENFKYAHTSTHINA